MSIESELQVSICCLVYNHEKYLRQCLDGFVMQKDVAFEVLIHDDASTDHSADIIREYEVKYPGIFKPIYQTENQYSKGVPINTTYQYPRAKGKYIAICEGDDFWTDPYKLKKQVQALEENPDCSACYHYVEKVYENGMENGYVIPSIKRIPLIIERDVFYQLFNSSSYLFQTTSYFFRTNNLKEYANDRPLYAKIADVGDIPMVLYMSTLGNAYFIREAMSCYRVDSIGSWNSQIQSASIERKITHISTMVNSYQAFEETIDKSGVLQGAILRCRLDKALLQDDYPAANRIIRKNRQYFSFQMRLSVWLHAHFPKLSKVLERIKHGKK